MTQNLVNNEKKLELLDEKSMGEGMLILCRPSNLLSNTTSQYVSHPTFSLGTIR